MATRARTTRRKEEEEGRKGREGFVQDECDWQRKPEKHGKKILFRIAVIGNCILNSTEKGRGGRNERREGSVQDRYG